MRPLRSVLIANRGEVAVRIIHACRELGMRSIAVYSDEDRGALHTRLADEAHRLGPAAASESYLHAERVLAVAGRSGADAIHPGYGLLSENPRFASVVLDAGLIFIGPSPQVIAQMGDKVAAREAAQRSGIPQLPGSTGPVPDLAAAVQAAERIGYPLLIKACFGGGGRGMRIVHCREDLEAGLQAAAREANAAFGCADVYLERYVPRGRHVEVQILADAHGNIVHLGDRDCSLQRRHQKLIEEAPAPGLSPGLRRALVDAALMLARDVGYRNAGTVEFLVETRTDDFYFLEMNTRLQVEHGVSELISGIDIVQAQMRIAAGEPLGFTQQDVQMRGCAMQARIAAEDPFEQFRPHSGTIRHMRTPLGPWLRFDVGIEAGDSISRYYDSMFGKLQAWGPDRESARKRLAIGLASLEVEGVPTTAPCLREVLAQPDFVAVTHDTGSLERDWLPRSALPSAPAPVVREAEPASALCERRVRLSTSQGTIEVAVFGHVQKARPVRGVVQTATLQSDVDPLAPIDGAVVKVCVQAGQRVEKGAVLVILEAMKMELPVTAPRAGIVEEVRVAAGDVTARGNLLVKLAPVQPPVAGE
ncbi:acetyl/propionyl/methylcrotonyl-CoA carboxylase subunit alpha [Povalibacter sp.]|uniref:acetyl/propionyl/methylcrotonyl-CoA carboxylase subunit alpha n=1 Tax=Povalibacter sp. TaxID=1962978 RepID=UPI002F403880